AATSEPLSDSELDALGQFEIFTHNLQGLIPNLDLNLNDLVNGLDRLLGFLQNTLQSGQVLGVTLPFVGNKLKDVADFIGSFRSQVIARLRAAPGMACNAVRDVLFDVFGSGPQSHFALGLLLNADGSPAMTPDAIATPFCNSDRLQWNLRLGHTYASDAAIDFDIGLP